MLGVGISTERGDETLKKWRQVTVWKFQPGITLAELKATGRHIVGQCRRLARPSDLDLRVTPVSMVGAVLKCCKCGSRAVLTYPETYRDARKGRMR